MLPETLALGKHAFVILTSYGIGAVALGGLILQSVISARRTKQALEAVEAHRNG